MWQFWGTIAVSALGGTFFIHYLKNFILQEKYKFAWDRDGLIERALITALIIFNRWLYLIPVMVLFKIVFRLILIGYFNGWLKSEEPGSASQKVKLKAELAFDLILSPAFAILVGVIF